MLNFKEEIAKAISEVTEIVPEELILSIEIPKEKTQGDYAFPCFRLAKVLKKSPKDIAEDIKSKISFKDNLIEKTEVAASGYLNFFVCKDTLAKTVIEEMISKKEEYGKSDIRKTEKILLSNILLLILQNLST